MGINIWSPRSTELDREYSLSYSWPVSVFASHAFLICYLGSDKASLNVSWTLWVSYRTVPWAAKGESISKTIRMQLCWVVCWLQKAEEGTQDVISSRLGVLGSLIQLCSASTWPASSPGQSFQMLGLACQADTVIPARTNFLRTSASAESLATSSGRRGHSNPRLLTFQFFGMIQKSKHELAH